jgi:hypothetical protein
MAGGSLPIWVAANMPHSIANAARVQAEDPVDISRLHQDRVQTRVQGAMHLRLQRKSIRLEL